ncbi:hypothetical protein CVIRNUC_001979 [Coccomyxa viridis]|uniref:Uncharacterized protein n=1 Tax=Coccomyxa viridis TaxID=1274662 RepID=A0AAV1HV56_9CHLO|nr:hypothetical protein CVIRNUC_001979 [Coccomyxa viridis]
MEFAKDHVLPTVYYTAGATYGVVEGLAKSTMAIFQGESPKTRSTDSKAYNSTMKKAEDAKDTANHKYNSAKASADKDGHGNSFYHSAKDKAYSAKDTAAHKAHETKDKVQDHAEDGEDEALSKGDKAKEKIKDTMKSMKHSVKHAAHKVHHVGHKMVHPNENK